MRIAFRKIPPEGIDVKLKRDNLLLSVQTKKESATLLLCEGKMTGTLAHQCDRCGQPINLEVDEDVAVFISDQAMPSSQEELFDAIEFFDGFVDFEELFTSEIEAYKSDYFYCSNCQNT
jgi:uncharacterized metal-binding protein YceD (DUF177 family)